MRRENARPRAEAESSAPPRAADARRESRSNDPDRLRPEQIRAHPEVREALADNEPEDVKEKPRRKLPRILILGLLAGAAALIVYLLDRRVLFRSLASWDWPVRILAALVATASLLAIHEIIAALVVPRFHDRISRFNVRRVMKLLTVAVIFFSCLSILFTGWYGAAVSLGLLSVILGFALQAPITSFFAWIYLLIKAPYRVGDRIRIGDATGDVIDVGYLDTTLWEFGGDLLSTDHPSGRLIRFPNSAVFNSTVFNYSWPLFPYVWNEIVVQVAYDADLPFVAETMRNVVEQERGTAMPERVRVYRELLASTPVDELEVSERPTVLFRVNANTWVDAIVRYLVTPRRSGRVKTILTQKILERLNARPDKVQFPKSNMR